MKDDEGQGPLTHTRAREMQPLLSPITINTPVPAPLVVILICKSRPYKPHLILSAPISPIRTSYVSHAHINPALYQAPPYFIIRTTNHFPSFSAPPKNAQSHSFYCGTFEGELSGLVVALLKGPKISAKRDVHFSATLFRSFVLYPGSF